MDRLTLRRPDDWHLHLRDGAALASVVADSARRFARAIVMPNLKPAVRTTAQAMEYRSRILAALPPSYGGQSPTRPGAAAEAVAAGSRRRRGTSCGTWIEPDEPLTRQPTSTPE